MIFIIIKLHFTSFNAKILIKRSKSQIIKAIFVAIGQLFKFKITALMRITYYKRVYKQGHTIKSISCNTLNSLFRQVLVVQKNN